jgi:hypothetical protein
VLLAIAACGGEAAQPRADPRPAAPDAAACGTPQQCFDAAKAREAVVDLAGAAVLFDAACPGHGEACVGLGLLTQDGRGVARDIDEAMRLYRQGCDEGHGVGCFNLGIMFMEGNGVAQDTRRADEEFAKARAAYERQCGATPPHACTNLGVLHEHGFGTPVSREKARAVYLRGCDGGERDACVNLSLLEIENGEPFGPAVSRLWTLCQDGHALSCGTVGHLQAQRQIDLEGTRALLRKGCDGGDRQSCALLGALTDPPEREAALEKACALGSSRACMAAGELTGDALYWKRACDIGDPEGCSRMPLTR